MSGKKPNELYIERIYDAPVKMVWEAWVDPKQAAKWWGPRGFTITTHSKELKVGGIWHYTMHGPDGVDYPNKTVYLEIKDQARLVYDHGGYDDRPPMFRVTVNFSTLGKKTKMEMTMAFPSEEVAKETAKFIKKAGGNGTWDRLAEYLSEDEHFVVNRSFAASIDKVFEMWTNPQHLPKWLPPGGFDMKFISVDIKTGGSSFYSMTNADGLTMFGKAFYQEVTRPARIIYKQIFCDESGNVSRHPMAPTWPENMLVTVLFTEEDKNQTRVTLITEIIGDANTIERDTFHGAKGGMTMGWNASFDRLDELFIM